jgi:hypothetical protein
MFLGAFKSFCLVDFYNFSMWYSILIGTDDKLKVLVFKDSFLRKHLSKPYKNDNSGLLHLYDIFIIKKFEIMNIFTNNLLVMYYCTSVFVLSQIIKCENLLNYQIVINISFFYYLFNNHRILLV